MLMIYNFTNRNGVPRPVEVQGALSLEQEALLADFISKSSSRCDELCVNKVRLTWQGRNIFKQLDLRGLTFEEELFMLRSCHVEASLREMHDSHGLVYSFRGNEPQQDTPETLPPHISAEQKRFNRLFTGKGV
ncbi:hypothetical protein ACQU0X_27915 [Pseudovibrio ascidiaceicola]|uniref:hypothetical protein n=1 Tax=Pseudovibrio ascidiaceicola TaxID=285279 RepID=UPI003D35F271